MLREPRRESEAVIRRRDIAWTIAVAVVSFTVYVATLAPGLIAITDTPKFQFIGRILGIAHSPGYPLYVIVSHFFGYLPIGTLAYRMNLMSALCGAAACAMTYLCARLIGACAPVAAAATFGFAFGSTFWYTSTIAEVYTFNAFFVTGVLLALLAWQRSRRALLFYTAVALVGVGAGNHTTIVFMVPATAIFACVVAPRFALHPRTIALAALITVAALTQYLFVVVRTRQGAWGDVHAWNLVDLFTVMTGSEYFGDIMPGGTRQFIERVPAVWHAFLNESTVAGVVLAVAGAIASVRRQPAVFLLLATVIIGYTGFIASYMPHEFEVFLIPALLAAWLFAAIGAQWAVDVLRARTHPSAAVLASAILVVVPGWEVARNYEARDLSHQRSDMRFFDSLFEQLPERSALVHDNFLIDRMVYYKTFGEEADKQRQIEALLPAVLEPVAAAMHDGRHVFAFPQTATAMRLFDGAEFSYTPFPLSNGSIERYLADLPPGTLVAAAVPGIEISQFASGGRLPLSAIGFNKILSGAAVDGVAVVGVRGGRSLDGVSYPIEAPGKVETTYRGASVTAPIVARAEGESASIVFGGREIVRTGSGMAIATWNRERLTAAFVVPAATQMTPGLPTPYAIYPLRAIREPVAIAVEPADLTPTLGSGQFIYTPPAGTARLVLYAGRKRPLAPRLEESSARDWPAIDVRRFDGPHTSNGELAQSLATDGFGSQARLLAMPHVYRIVIDTNWSFPTAVRVGLGGVPDGAFVRLASGKSAGIRSIDLGSHLRRADDRTWVLQMTRDYQTQLVGSGWSPVQFDGIAGYRETTDREAELLLPLPAERLRRIGVQLLRLPGGDAQPESVTLQIGGHALPGITPTAEWQRYWWTVPAADAIEGLSSLVLAPGDRQRIAVSDVLLETAP